MHQTFYIDIDEEITSVVYRLREAKANEVVIVIPKRALIIQSLVNLKLLKKEAEDLGLRIMVVTQDKLGKMLVEKAGILAQERLDDTLDEEVIYEAEEKGIIREIPEERLGIEDSAKKSLRKIGSDSYFEDKKSLSKKAMRSRKGFQEKDSMEKITNKELVSSVSSGKERRSIFGKSSSDKKTSSFDLSPIRKGSVREETKIRKVLKETQEEEILDRLYQKGVSRHDLYRPKDIKIPSKFWKKFIYFSAIPILAVGILTAYIFLPEAKITIFTKGKIQSMDAEIKGDSSINEIDYELETVPAKVISIEEESSKTFEVSGKKSVSNEKASGTITIYNEYSEKVQPLVATTRFETPDGKIFRLKKSISVPGMTKVENEMKAGAIEAEVVADEAGEQYNIEPSNFTIPGFKDSGNEKYSKIYAKSSKAMTGGGSGSQEVKTVQAGDIEKAKNELLAEMNSKMKQKIKETAGDEYEIPEEAINMSDAEYKVSNSTGEAVENFTVSLKMKISAIAVKKEDLKNLLAKMFAKKTGFEKIKDSSLAFDFGKTDADFNRGNVLMRLHATAKTASEINLEEIKQNVLGKNEDQLKDFLGTYPEIEKFTIEYSPTFISGKVPMYERQVEVSLDNN
jgi:hypothetical protein